MDDDAPSTKRRRLSDPEPRRLSNTSEQPSTVNASDDEQDTASPDPSDPPEFTARRGYTVKRSGEPPRNDDGKFVCKLDDRCRSLTFDRRCEWGKHMDKHERPYRCDRPECSKLNGFTYSGGLLRHQREVHKMHGSTTKLFCSEPNCKRASGSGFTRKENLFEHLRRVHRRTSPTSLSVSNLKPATAQPEANGRPETTASSTVTTPIKRQHDEELEEDEESNSEPSHKVRTLRLQISQRDKTIRDQYARIQLLERRLESLERGSPSG